MPVPIKQIEKKVVGRNMSEQGNYSCHIMVDLGRFSTKPEFLQSPNTSVLKPEYKNHGVKLTLTHTNFFAYLSDSDPDEKVVKNKIEEA